MSADDRPTMLLEALAAWTEMPPPATPLPDVPDEQLGALLACMDEAPARRAVGFLIAAHPRDDPPTLGDFVARYLYEQRHEQ